MIFEMKSRLVTIGFLWQVLFGFTGLYSQKTNFIQLKLEVPPPGPVRMENLISDYRIREKPLPLNRLPVLMESILRIYEDEGYPFVKSRLDTIRLNEDQLMGTVTIDPGQKIIIDSILNRTGYRLSPAVLRRIMNISPGEPYSESAVREANLRLSRIEWMIQKRPLEVGFHDNLASVFVYPEKAGTNRFDGWVGLTPVSAGSSKMAFSGTINLGLNNLAGQGEVWDLMWRRTQDQSQQLKTGVRLPYLAGMPFGLEGVIDLYRQDTSWFNLFAEGGIPYYFSPDNRLSLFYRYHSSNLLIENAPDGLIPRRSFQTHLTGLSWKFLTLDNRANPRRGLDIQAEVLVGSRAVADSASMTRSEADFHFSGYLPVSSRFVLAGHAAGGAILASGILENECFRIGGVGDLIGFDENQFRSDRYLVAAAEMRYLLDPFSYLLVRINAGMLGQDYLKIPDTEFPWGFGLGGQIMTGGGIFRIIFAMGTASGSSVQWRNSKIHIGYIGLF